MPASRNYHVRKAKAASERGRKMAQARWARDRERREALAAMDPVRLGGIVRRIVVIEREAVVREVVIFDFDSRASARRKLRSVGL